MATEALDAERRANLQLKQAQENLIEQKAILQQHLDLNKHLENQLSETQIELKTATDKFTSSSLRNDITIQGLSAEKARVQQLTTSNEQFQLTHIELQKQRDIAQHELAEIKKQIDANQRDVQMDHTVQQQFDLA